MKETRGKATAQVAEAGRRVFTRRSTVATLAVAAGGALAVPMARLATFLRGFLQASQPSEPNLQKGLELHRERRYDEAVRAFTTVIESHPTASEAHLFRGIALFNAGRIDESIADFSKLLEMRPNDARSYLYRGESYLVLGDRLRAALDFQQTLDLAGGDARLAAAAQIKLRTLEGTKGTR